MDDAARQLAEASFPHVPAALLAHLYRLGEPFPENTEPLADTAIDAIQRALTCLRVEAMPGGAYLRYWCPDCRSVMFQPNTKRGVAHASRVDRAHKPDCCAERAARYAETGIDPVWPDRLDE